MDETYLLQAFTMYFLSLWKTYIGPLLAAAGHFGYFEMLVFNLGAAVTSIIGTLLLTDFWIAKRTSSNKGFNKNLRRALRLWKKYGKVGSAVLAPILIGIPTYTLVARRLKSTRRSIIIELTLITFAWCTVIYWAGREGLLIAEGWI